MPHRKKVGAVSTSFGTVNSPGTGGAAGQFRYATTPSWRMIELYIAEAGRRRFSVCLYKVRVTVNEP
jgi:hypothetical protein